MTPTILALDELLMENIFNHPMFLIAGEVITQKRYQWEDSGIVKISDLLDSNSKTFQTKVISQNQMDRILSLFRKFN